MVASLIETFHEPMHVIEEKFTTSELGIIAWRSQEQSYHMSKKMKQGSGSSSGYEGTANHTPEYDANRPPGEGTEYPSGLPAHFFNKDGELDLRNASEKEVLQYFRNMGRPLPVFHRG